MRLPTLAATAVVLAASASAQSPVAAPVHTISLYSYGYTPNPIRLRAGQPVTLQFVNRSGSGHDFTSERFFRSARLIAGAPAGGEIDLKSGGSASVTLVPARGTYRVHCGHFFHKQLGMRGTIIVQ